MADTRGLRPIDGDDDDDLEVVRRAVGDWKPTPRHPDGEPVTDDDDDGVPLYVLWRDRVVELNLDDLTGLDHARFRQTMGMSIGEGLKGGALDGFACLLWLKLRKTQRKLKYQQVAKQLTMSDLLEDDDPRVLAHLGKERDPEA